MSFSAACKARDLAGSFGIPYAYQDAEFKNKEDMFLESLRYYLQTRGGLDILSNEPKGLSNIRRFLEIGHTCYSGRRGCFSVNSLRDIAMQPPEARRIIEENDTKLKRLLTINLKAGLPRFVNAGLPTDMIFTFFAGLCIEQNAQVPIAVSKRKIDRFMEFLALSV
jgi:hypothetical protein